MGSTEKKSCRAVIVLIGIVLGIVLELFLTVRAFRAGEWQPASELDLGKMIGENRLQMENCAWEDGSLVSSENGAMFFIYGTENWGIYEFSFEEPFEESVTAEWYYLPAGTDAFDRFSRQEGYIMPGTQTVKIRMPEKNDANVRFNIHGNFHLKSIRVSTRPSWGELSLRTIAGHIHVLRAMLFVLFGICGSLIYADEKRAKKTKNESAARHYVYLDGIRVLAAFLVIVVHVIEPLAYLYPMGSKRYILLESLSAFALNCNVLFVMISGALLLPWKEESWGAFFRKRFMKVLVPLMVYGIFYIRFCCISEMDAVSWLCYGIKTILGGNFVKGPHLWLIYVLLGLYVIVIPLRMMLKNMSEHSQKVLTMLILICLAVNTVFSLTGNEIGIRPFLGQWPGIFLMGYMLNQKWMRKYDGLVVAGGAAAAAATVAIVMTKTSCMNYIANESVISVLMSSAIFAVLIHMDRILSPARTVLAAISRYSYSIILIHWFVLIRIVHNGWFSSGMNQYLQAVLPILWCGVLSWMLAWAVDRMVVDVLTDRKIWGSCRKLFKRDIL